MTTTKQRLVEAALASVREEGYSGTTARGIAARAGVNQALIYYHFGDMQRLFLAALDETGARRMERYEALLADVATIDELVELARTIYTEDVEAGHVTVLSELIGGSLQHPELGPGVIQRLQPWIDFTARAVDQVAAGTVLQDLIPTRDLAAGVVAFYLGIDLLHQLDPEQAPAGRLFDHASRLAPALGWLVQFGSIDEEETT